MMKQTAKYWNLSQLFQSGTCAKFKELVQKMKSEPSSKVVILFEQTFVSLVICFLHQKIQSLVWKVFQNVKEVSADIFPSRTDSPDKKERKWKNICFDVLERTLRNLKCDLIWLIHLKSFIKRLVAWSQTFRNCQVNYVKDQMYKNITASDLLKSTQKF